MDSASVCSIRSRPRWSTLSSSRAVGPEMPTVATTSLSGPKTGAATPESPISSSSWVTAKPRARTCSRSSSRALERPQRLLGDDAPAGRRGGRAPSRRAAPCPVPSSAAGPRHRSSRALRAGRSSPPARRGRRGRRWRRRGGRSRRSPSPIVSSSGRASRASSALRSCRVAYSANRGPPMYSPVLDPLDQPGAFEGREQARRGGAGQARGLAQLGEGDRGIGLHDEGEQRRSAVDGLRAAPGRSARPRPR